MIASLGYTNRTISDPRAPLADAASIPKEPEASHAHIGQRRRIYKPRRPIAYMTPIKAQIFATVRTYEPIGVDRLAKLTGLSLAQARFHIAGLVESGHLYATRGTGQGNPITVTARMRA